MHRLRRRPQRNDCHGHDQKEFEAREIQHCFAPAEIGDGAREDRRPERAGEIGAARNQRQRRAAPAVEPLADINIERRIDAADAEEPDEQAVADIKRPGKRQSRPQRR